MPYYKTKRKQIIPTVGEIPVNSIVEANGDLTKRFGDDFEKCGKPNAKQKLAVIKIDIADAPSGDKAVANSDTKGAERKPVLKRGKAKEE